MKRDRARNIARGRWTVAAVIVGTVALTGAGWAASQLMTTPAQIAARAEAPPSSIVTVPVEFRIVSDQIVTRGEVISAQLTNVLSGRVVAGVTSTVVTALPLAVGADVAPGSVVVQLSGRPVFALPGAFPAYRDLTAGAVGPDVAQLQKALKSIGYSLGGDKAGVFSMGTTAAIAKLYKKAKYDPPTTLLAAEVMFIPVFPAHVESMTAQIGSISSAVNINIATGNLTVSVPADPQLMDAARAGDKVEVSSEIMGQTVSATISAVAIGIPAAAAPDPAASTPAASDSGGATPSAPAMTVVPDTPLPVDWAGQNVRVTVINASSDGKVLAVPVSAVNAAADGTTRVIVISRKGANIVRTSVEVVAGVTGGGFVGVSAVGGTLAVGDDVLVGVK
jgi:peptidoglycan hydrolase-like protein with peptidoglycan-binding domain